MWHQKVQSKCEATTTPAARASVTHHCEKTSTIPNGRRQSKQGKAKIYPPTVEPKFAARPKLGRDLQLKPCQDQVRVFRILMGL